MAEENTGNNPQVTDPQTPTNPPSDPQAEKTYTQAEFDKHMGGLRKKFETQIEKEKHAHLETWKAENGITDDLLEKVGKKMSEAEKLQRENAKLKADLEQTSQAHRQYLVKGEILSACSKLNCVDPDLVFSALRDQVKVSDEGMFIEDKPLPEYIGEYLKSKPHLVRSMAPRQGAATPTNNSNPSTQNWSAFISHIQKGFEK